MALKSIAIAEAGEAEFVTVDEQSWQVQKYID
jgi:hypothetical protein